MLIPSIDILNGRAVQLRQGKQQLLSAIEDPVSLARRFNRYGEVAVIDLDAALGKGENRELIRQICAVADVRVGGGIRDRETADFYLRAGARRLIIGTSATPEFLGDLPADRILVALDHKGGEVVDQGWQRSTGQTVHSRAEALAEHCAGFLVTIVDREGTRRGLPVEEVNRLRQTLHGELTVAGGVSDADNAIDLVRLGVDVQVGMALYTGNLDPAQVAASALNWEKESLLPTIVQDDHGQVLMLAYSTRESLQLALERGRGIYYSRSRSEIWEKGLTSGNTQQLLSMRYDCDRDAILFRVEQRGPACHTDTYSCFGEQSFDLSYLHQYIQQRKEQMPPGSFTARLFSEPERIDEKLREEVGEVITFTSRKNLVWELGDLLYFTLVKAAAHDISFQELLNELKGRHK